MRKPANGRKRQTVAKARNPNTVAQCKQDIGYESFSASQIAGSDRPVIIRYLSFRNRLIDYENLWTKYPTDSLVTAGVLEDDKPSIVVRVEKEQIKCKKTEEKTIIEIYEAVE